MWYWFDNSNNSWILASESIAIEAEYQTHLAGTRYGQRVYHCFGDGGTALIDFKKMTTCCGSGRCMLTHEQRSLRDDHMTYRLKREMPMPN